MHRIFKGLALFIASVALSASAQTVTGSGTANTIPLFTGSSTLGNSVLTQSGSSSNPNGRTVIQVTNNSTATGNTQADLVLANSSSTGEAFITGTGYSAYKTIHANDFGLYSNGGNMTLLNDGGNINFTAGGGASVQMLVATSGNVGIGTTTPGAKLEVDGNVKLTSGSGASITFADGTTQSTAYTGVTCGGDYAESIDAIGGQTDYAPGDLLVIDPKAPGRFLKSTKSYSTLVAGIYSTKPGTIGRRETAYAKTDTTAVPMAMVGIVPTKVSTENGPIETGDLLVTSSTMGYAMKGTDRTRLTGAVVGKALAPLDSGKGVIEVLVTLQ